MEELTVVWNGSHKDVYLCIPPIPKAPERLRPIDVLGPDRLKYESRATVRAEMVRLLPLRADWRVKDLIEQLDASYVTVYGLLRDLKLLGLVVKSGYGVVRWAGRQKDTAA